MVLEPRLFFSYSDLSYEPDTANLMYQSIVCREFDVAQLDVLSVLQEWNFNSHFFSSETIRNLADLYDFCYLNFTSQPNNFILTEPVHSLKPVLIVGGAEDKITIPRYVHDLSATMPNAHTTVFDDLGHGVFNESECVNNSIISYLLSSDGSYQNECLNN
jgi:pimeloyl-ACP methyl ester carboxylesterase